MPWRLLLLAPYALLAVVVGVADGPRGLFVLLAFYAFAAVWLVALLVWGAAARAAGLWNVRRLEAPRPDDGAPAGPPPGGDMLRAHEEAAEPVPARARRRALPAL